MTSLAKRAAVANNGVGEAGLRLHQLVDVSMRDDKAIDLNPLNIEFKLKSPQL